MSLGSNRTAKLHANVGDSYERLGWLVEAYGIRTDGFKELPNGANTGFDVEDYLGKLRVNTGRKSRVYQELEVKIGKTTQASRETYLGLTDEDFAAGPFVRYAVSERDVLHWDHEQYQFRHFVAFSGNLDLTTAAYRNSFSRNWYKLQSVSGTSIIRILGSPDTFSEELATIRGAASDADALSVRANKRSYFSSGVQSILGWHVTKGRAGNLIELGFRYHADQEDRFQHEDGFRMADGRMVLTRAGAPGSQSNRVSDAQAWAFFVQDRIDLGRWSLTPGLRYEGIELTRTDYATDDPGRSRVERVRQNRLGGFIPGVGLTLDIRTSLRLLAGIHKGFSPPRTRFRESGGGGTEHQL